MTEVSFGAANAETPVQASGETADNGSTAGTSGDVFSGLQDAGNREWVTSKGYKELDAVVSSAKHADKLQSELAEFKTKALTPLKDDATKEESDAFYAKLGRPDKPEAYDFKLPEGLPENLPYDGESAAKYKQWAHEAGLSPKQAQAIHDNFVRSQADAVTAHQEALSQRSTAAHGELVKVWGDASSEGYSANLASANRFIANNGGDALLAEFKAVGTMGPKGEVLSPLLAQAMAKAGKALYSEGGLVTGQSSTEAARPENILYPANNDPFRPNR